MKPRAEFGVFGGSGFYKFAKGSRGVSVATPYGKPSAKVTLSEIEGKRVAFLPRHGVHHEFPPHMVPYRANLFAFKKLGVGRIIAPNAVGSLKSEVGPGDLVFCDQFVNFTTGRKDTFYDGPLTTHVSTASPYCPQMRRTAVEAAQVLGLKFHEAGTVVVIQGPRFSTKAESRFFSRQRWDVINMTQYPEVVLAREQEMCFLNISLVTDYDAGLEGDPTVKAVSHEEVIRVFNRNLENLRKLIEQIVKRLPAERTCGCGSALEHARLTA
ncbi:MAG: S-methyl-5'-thioadenosine phosphorylase [Nitrososphaerota archaeon]|nr:S-methyl-5'-thioadenosine phosphorylase [Nitrososphaerota archaeon]MDG6983450.1 S-methyl-5'-thioadenosine phosphorylase [Nitrososphaerota archaeon]